MKGVSKYEKECLAVCKVYADEISLYPQKAMGGFITYATDHMGEEKNAPIKVRLIRCGDRPWQFAFELQGDYHTEKLFYFSTDPSKWLSYGKIWLSMKQAKKMIEWLSACIRLVEARVDINEEK